MNRNVVKVYKDSFTTVMRLFDFAVINLTYIGLLCISDQTISILDIAVALVIAFMFLSIGIFTGFYDLSIHDKKRKILLKLTFNSVCLVSILWALRHALETLPGMIEVLARESIVHSEFLWSYLIILASRIVLTKIQVSKPKIAILGMTPIGLSVEKGLVAKYGSSIVNNISYFDERAESRFGYITRGSHQGTIDDLLTIAKNNEVDEIYIALPMVARDRIRNFLRILSDSTVDIMIVPDLYSYHLSSAQLRDVGGIQSFSVFASPFEGLGGIIKRVIDIVVGSLITLMILPVMAVIALGVKLSSPGPVLFKQDRYGLGGKKIKVWKFRSMKVMENDAVVTQATKGDPRVTKFGSFIRRTSLDELPQFFNVLQGTMSIVGPRPHAVSHNEEYRKIVDNYMIRHKVKPGITGLAQIKGYRGETDTVDKMVKRVEYDIRYMQNWTPIYDFKIIFLTIFKGFVSETAY
ncbi:undecaprenyl-phosphate glucose phosphotransferase [Vibrio sp. CK2-1]|uniref:undecaprenyl-phosphate glucose phosphotransferase n=1 Tax=Vibrio sp. CK2-1 TaxID=2912249 RepID=UPI001F372E8C|nr:undecaprenyl-phosphate glucose phosphotransferase [Vibrio sp. CK2-1]MCF7353043.1 undecaprenyl-phosphate glucose phosphotransferase [Vibrio sp. CK2-1]